MTIYEDLLAAGIQVSNHESDLYCPVTPESRALVRKHELMVTTFINQVEGGTWYDIPFAYDPFWARRRVAA